MFSMMSDISSRDKKKSYSCQQPAVKHKSHSILSLQVIFNYTVIDTYQNNPVTYKVMDTNFIFVA